MRKALFFITILFISVMTTACVNNPAVQELNNKANEYLQRGEYEKALCRLESSAELDSNIFETQYNLGIVYTESEKYQQAIEAFSKALALKPEHSDTYYSLGVANENYAKSLIEGSVKFNSQIMDEQNNKELPSAKETAPKEFNPEEKMQLRIILNSAVDAYTRYINKEPDSVDKGEVEDKIKYLNDQIAKYSDDKAE